MKVRLLFNGIWIRGLTCNALSPNSFYKIIEKNVLEFDDYT